MLLFGNLSKEINFSDYNLAQDKEEDEEEREEPEGRIPRHDGKGYFFKRVLVDFR